MVRNIWLCCCLFVSVWPSCPSGSSPNSQEHCLHFETGKRSWSDAETFCKSKGGHLASIHNAIDNSIIHNLATTGNCPNYYVGGSCASSKCSWIDGTDFSYNNWQAGSPSSSPLSHISVEASSSRWSTVSGDDASCFVCELSGGMSDCRDWYNSGFTDDGEYEISLNNVNYVVYCDMTTAGGGWTVFQRRVDGSDPYWNRTWAEYKQGFGPSAPNSNYWAGNELIHQLTSKNQNVTMRVELHGDGTPGSNFTNDYWFNQYNSFLVGPETDFYRLRLELYWDDVVGNASTGWYDITCSSGSPFSTLDKINDPQKDCVTKYQMGGWWLYNCALSSLNGAYTPIDWNTGYGLFWILNGGDLVIHPRKTTMLLKTTDK